MKKLCLIVITIYLLLTINGCSLNLYSDSNDISNFDQSVKAEKKLSAGDVFEKGTYIDISNVRLLYDGDMFLIQNSNTYPVRLSYTIVGMKKDGTFDEISMSALSGIDKTQYDNDLAENGWAIEQYTNLVRPNSTLEASLDFSNSLLYYSDEQVSNDIDNDGYIDLFFTVSPQKNEEQIVTSSDDPVSEIYKVKVE